MIAPTSLPTVLTRGPPFLPFTPLRATLRPSTPLVNTSAPLSSNSRPSTSSKGYADGWVTSSTTPVDAPKAGRRPRARVEPAAFATSDRPLVRERSATSAGKAQGNASTKTSAVRPEHRQVGAAEHVDQTDGGRRELVDQALRASAGLNDSNATSAAGSHVPRQAPWNHAPARTRRCASPTILRPSSIMTSPLETAPKHAHRRCTRHHRSSDQRQPPDPKGQSTERFGPGATEPEKGATDVDLEEGIIGRHPDIDPQRIAGDDEHRAPTRPATCHLDAGTSWLARHRRGNTAVSTRAPVPVAEGDRRPRRDGSVARRLMAIRRGARHAVPVRRSTLQPPGADGLAQAVRRPRSAEAVRRGRGDTEIGVPVVAGPPAQSQQLDSVSGSHRVGAQHHPHLVRKVVLLAGVAPAAGGNHVLPCVLSPRLRGITWSRFSAAEPQYWQREPSRAKTVRRLTATR